MQLQLFGLALFVLAVILTGFTWWVIRYILIEQPRRQIEILTRFAPQVIDQVQSEYGNSSKRHQRLIAIARLKAIFDDEGIATPGDSMIETAISSEMYRRQQEQNKKNTDELWIKELKKDMMCLADTTEIPVTPREDLWIL